MSWQQKFSHIWLVNFSKPAGERCLYRAIHQHGVRSIVELGVGMGQRAERMLATAATVSADRPLRYAGIDLFEARSGSSPGMTLKRAHQTFRPLVSRLHLVPGDPLSALMRTSNSLSGIDLLVVAADQDAASLRQAWFYVPRMIHEATLIFVEHRLSEGGKTEFRLMPHTELRRLASQSSLPRAA